MVFDGYRIRTVSPPPALARASSGSLGFLLGLLSPGFLLPALHVLAHEVVRAAKMKSRIGCSGRSHGRPQHRRRRCCAVDYCRSRAAGRPRPAPRRKSPGSACGPVVKQPAVVVRKQHRVDLRRQPLRQLDRADLLERPQRESAVYTDDSDAISRNFPLCFTIVGAYPMSRMFRG